PLETTISSRPPFAFPSPTIATEKHLAAPHRAARLHALTTVIETIKKVSPRPDGMRAPRSRTRVRTTLTPPGRVAGTGRRKSRGRKTRPSPLRVTPTRAACTPTGVSKRPSHPGHRCAGAPSGLICDKGKKAQTQIEAELTCPGVARRCRLLSSHRQSRKQKKICRTPTGSVRGSGDRPG